MKWRRILSPVKFMNALIEKHRSILHVFVTIEIFHLFLRINEETIETMIRRLKYRKTFFPRTEYSNRIKIRK